MPPAAAPSDPVAAAPEAADTAMLLARLAAGRDDRAWEALVARHAAAMRRAALAVAGRTALADDAVQEALLQVRDRARLFRPPDADRERAAGAWLRRIAATCALQLLRAERRRTRHERAAEESAVRTPPPTVDQAAEDAELRAAVMAELAALPERQREPIVLHLLAGLDHAAVGERIGCSAATARVRLHRALERLRERLGARRSTTLAGMFALVGAPDGVEPSASTLSAWRALLRSPARPRLSRRAVFGGAAWGMRVAALLLIGLVGGMLLWSADAAPSPRPPAPKPAGPIPFTKGPAIDAAVENALEASVSLELRRDTLLETLRFIDAQLPPDAAVWWRAPASLMASGSLLISGSPRGEVRFLLAQLAGQNGLRWEARDDTIAIWRPLPEAEAARIQETLAKAQRAHDVDAWTNAAEEALASGDIDLRRAIVRTVGDTDANLAAAARQCALAIGGERVASVFTGDAAAGAGLMAWIAADSQALRDPRFWGLWADVRPANGFGALLKLIDTALDGTARPDPDGARRVAALALPTAARTATAAQLRDVSSRIARCHDLDVAVEALCILARRKDPAATRDCRALAAGGDIDRKRWSAFTDRLKDKQALTVLRYRPSLALLPGWWSEDARFGRHGVISDLSQCAFDPLYQEPAIEALVAARDPEVLGRLRECAVSVDPNASESGATVQINGMGAMHIRMNGQLQLEVAQEQAMAWLASAGEKPDLPRLLRLVDAYDCWHPSGAGAPDLLLRLVRAGTKLDDAERKRLARGLFVHAQSIGGMMEVGMPNRFLPWLAHFNGLDDLDLIGAVSKELAKTDYHAITATGSSGGQWGFPIYQRLAQSLAAMRTPAALAALRAAQPKWVQQPEAGIGYWYLALGYARDPDCTRILTDAASRPGGWSGYAIAALAATRDEAAFAAMREALPRIAVKQQYGWSLMNLVQDGFEWAPRETTAALIAACDAGNLRREAAQELARAWAPPRDAARRAAAIDAARKLLALSDGADAGLAQAALGGLARPGWPSEVEPDIRAALERILATSTDAAARKTAATGLAARRADPRVRARIDALAAGEADAGVKKALTADASR